jgi:hypothetical protein
VHDLAHAKVTEPLDVLRSDHLRHLRRRRTDDEPAPTRSLGDRAKDSPLAARLFVFAAADEEEGASDVVAPVCGWV